MKQAGLKWNHR